MKSFPVKKKFYSKLNDDYLLIQDDQKSINRAKSAFVFFFSLFTSILQMFIINF